MGKGLETYAVIDLETTGSSFSKGHRIMQIGITMIQNNQVTQEYDFVVNPGVVIPAPIEQLTGITNQQVKHAPFFEDVASYISHLIESCTLVAHNVAFDYHFLSESFAAIGINRLTQPAMDTVDLARILFPTEKGYRLSDLSEAFGIAHNQAHNAASDATATAHLFLRLQEKARSLPLVTLEKLISLGKELPYQTNDFFEERKQEAIQSIPPLSEEIEVVHSIALSKPVNEIEQTAYRAKESLTVSHLWDHVFVNRYQEERTLQLEMRDAVYNHLQSEHGSLAIEAPPGIGKTLAYVVPSILTATPQNKVFISTATLLLQEQVEEVVNTLIPLVPFPIQSLSLVSKRHIIDLTRLEQLDESKLTGSERILLMGIYVWLTKTQTGNLLEVASNQQSEQLLEKISSTSYSKEASPKWQDYDFSARYEERARSASLLFTNHAYLAHHAKEITMYAKDATHLIVDEAHRLQQAFLDKELVMLPVSQMKRTIRSFLIDIESYRHHLEAIENTSYPLYDLLNFEFAFEHLVQAVESLENKVARFARSDSESNEELEQTLSKTDMEEGAVRRSMRTVEKCLGEVQSVGLQYLNQVNHSLYSQFERRVARMMDRCSRWTEAWENFYDNDPSTYYTCQHEQIGEVDSYRLTRGKWDVRESMNHQLSAFGTRLYTSTTLTLDQDGTYFQSIIGEPNIPMILLKQEEPVRRNILLPLKEELPSVQRTNEWARKVAQILHDSVGKAGVKTLVLFTATKLLDAVYHELKTIIQSEHSMIDLLAQGHSGSRRRIHRRFTDSKGAILLGTGMYWEGIDFESNPVDVVVITRLPFDHPNRPDLRVMEQAFQREKKNFFQLVLLPRMLMKLKQAFGRIARSKDRSGLVICLDERFLDAPYAKKIQHLLPEGTNIVRSSSKDWTFD